MPPWGRLSWQITSNTWQVRPDSICAVSPGRTLSHAAITFNAGWIPGGPGRCHQYYEPLIMRSADGDQVILSMRLFNVGPPEDSEDAWRRAGSLGTGDRAVPSASNEDQLIRLITKLVANRMSGYLDMVAAGRLLALSSSLDWAYIAERLRTAGHYSVGTFALWHAAMPMCATCSVPSPN